MALRGDKAEPERRHPTRSDLLRAIPPVDLCVQEASKLERWQKLRRDYLVMVVRRAQAALRDDIACGRIALDSSRERLLDEVLRRVEATIEADEQRLKTVINATGVVIHTNLGRAPLAKAAVEALVRAASEAINLEYDLERGERGDRDSLVEEELCALTGAEAATVVNNNAAAVLLALNSLAEGREVIVSRGELIEIGGSFRIPEIMAKSGAKLREVGTTNRTHLRDYAAAIGPETALLLKVHPSNYRIVGFTAEVSLEALVELANRYQLPVMEDLGSGALIDLTSYGLPREPVVRERVKAGATVVTFSGDKLLGGPQAGLIVGKRAVIDRIKTNPLKRALRCGKLTLAALSATLRLYLRAQDLGDALPTLQMLRRPAQELARIAERISQALAQRLGSDYLVEPTPTTAQVGSGALPAEELPSWGIAISHRTLGPEAIAAKLRRARPPIIGRIERDRVILDLRSVVDPDALLLARLDGG